MFLNYLKIAFRDLMKRKVYAFLNIIGLAIGITCFMLIFDYVAHERSYDAFNLNAGRILRLRLDLYKQGELLWKSATVYPAIAPTMKKDFPEIENFCRLMDCTALLSNEEHHVKFSETKGYFADPSSLSILSIEMEKGNPGTALAAPNSIILSEATARKYFGDEDPLGKRLISRDPQSTQSLEVTGIFKDYPHTSHLIINYLVSYATLTALVRQGGDTTNATETSFGWYDFYSYLQMKPGTDISALEAKLPGFCARYIDNQEWSRTNNMRHELSLLPLTDIHLHSNYNQEAEVNGNGQAVAFLFLIAFFIIGIAWINYVNLATARSMDRAREIGVRKVLGAVRLDLIRQFLIESLLLNAVALVVSLLVVFEVAPAFHDMIGTAERSAFSLTAGYWIGAISIFILGALLSGLYPAFVMSGYQPATVLKGAFKNRRGSQALRKGLIVAQFAASVALIAGTIIVYRQVDFMRQQKLGADIDQTLVLEGASSIPDSSYQGLFQPFKNEALTVNGVRSLTSSSSVMGKEIYWTNGARRLNAPGGGVITLYILGADYDFVPSFGLVMKAGRNFSRSFSTDNKAALLNEEAVRQLGFENGEKAVTQRIIRGRDTLAVVGVVADFHQQGLRKVVDPMVILLQPNMRQFYSIKLHTTDIQQTISSLQRIWDKHFPADPLNYFFLDDFFDSQYKSEVMFGKIFGSFAFLAILIACFGLLGLSAYNVVQRTKEIGIRKVMGASVQNLVFLLSKDFLVLVVIAFFVATPLAWWAMNTWLQGFAYRISMGVDTFLFAGFTSVLITLLTVSYQAVRAALTNPVEALRYE